MKFNENLTSIHSYLCADGYVIKNPKTQKQKYYYIGFRNTNLVLLKDFQKKFFNYFKIKPRLNIGERCIVQKKELYEKLTSKFGSFYSKEWVMPLLNDRLSKKWLRTFFDCEGWVFCKTHQNRHIGLDSVNEKGLNQIIKSLNKLGIKTIKKVNKKRGIFRIFIYGKGNLIKFSKEIGFLHPDKKEKLDVLIKDFVEYKWSFPSKEKECELFVKDLLNKKVRIKKPYYIRIVSKEEVNLNKLNQLLYKFYKINGKVNKRINGIGTIYYELNINRREDIQKLINKKLIKNILKEN
ncbi:MAG: LAGLIDADG family homing endonuclease [archaeon]